MDSWKNTEVEIASLRMAVGLDTPDEAFWSPLGAATSSVAPRDKVNFLARIISYIGCDDSNGDLLKELPSFLISTVQEIQQQLATKTISEADCQLLATELIICEYLTSKKTPSATCKKITDFVKDKNFPVVATRLLETLKSRWDKVSLD